MSPRSHSDTGTMVRWRWRGKYCYNLLADNNCRTVPESTAGVSLYSGTTQCCNRLLSVVLSPAITLSSIMYSTCPVVRWTQALIQCAIWRTRAMDCLTIRAIYIKCKHLHCLTDCFTAWRSTCIRASSRDQLKSHLSYSTEYIGPQV